MFNEFVLHAYETYHKSLKQRKFRNKMWHSDDTEVQVREQGETGREEIAWSKTEIHMVVEN